MSYQKTSWINNITPINADNLNNIENGIESNDTSIGDMTQLETTADDLVDAINEIMQNAITDSNASYFKLGDFLICWGNTQLFNINGSATYHETINLPATYKDTNYICICSFYNGGSQWANGAVPKMVAISTNEANLDVGNYISSSQAQNLGISYITIGKWR